MTTETENRVPPLEHTQFRFEPDRLDLLDRIARARGMTRSEWIRETLNMRLHRARVGEVW